MKVINKIYIFITLIIFLSIGFLYHSILKIDEQTKNNIEKILISKANYISKNVDEEIKKKVEKNLFETLKNNPKLRIWLEDAFSISVTPSFKYIYILYRDKSGNYRYLLDGSKEDKGEFNQRLNVDKERWDKAYDTKEVHIIMQNNIDKLFITYLKPILFNGKVEAILAIDFSTTLLYTINNAVAPIKKIFLYIFAAIFFLLFILIYQIILNIYTKKESITDPLTQTYNRNFLRDFLKNINLSKYQIAMLDIDYFKKINDNYGHKAGDYILAQTAEIIRDSIRPKDVLVRFGGEEFLIFFYKEKDKKTDAFEISQRIRKNLQDKNFSYEGVRIKLTASLGVVLKTGHYKTIHDAIKKADERLYLAKKQGRNKVVAQDKNSLSNSNNEYVSISDVKEALDHNRIICHYQPIVNLSSSEIVKNEALVRMIAKDGNIIYPNSFLDVIHNTNIYNDMTKMVLDIVFLQIRQYKSKISINLNLSDILNTNIYQIVLEELEKNKNLANYLTIELLEYEQIDEEILQERLLHIKSFGVSIALDDFGSGYSNFSIFQTLPIDILKIDGSIIKNINTSKVAFSIVDSIILFCKRLDIEVVAEFVHSEEILNIVKDLGVENGQGFHLAKPREKMIKKL